MRTQPLNQRERGDRLTLLAFLATVVMLFAAFTAAYLIRRTGADWKPVRLPATVWLNTGVLIASSVVLEMARRRKSHVLARTGAALGLLFLAGQVLVWWILRQEGVYLPSNPHASFFYVVTALHGLHMLGGLVALAWFSRRGGAVGGLCASYWHFLCGVWLYLLALLTSL